MAVEAIISLSIAACVLYLLAGCWRTDTTNTGSTNRTTVTKETKVHEGAEPWKSVTLRKETVK